MAPPQQPDNGPPPGPGNVAINATDGSAAAYCVDTVNAYITVEASALLERFLQHQGVLTPPDGDPATGIRERLSRQSPDVWVHDAVTAEFSRLRGLPEFALEDYYNTSQVQTLSDRVVDATRTTAGTVAVLAFWGEPGTDRWWMPKLERLARIDRRGGSGWLLNLPLIGATMVFYAAGTAAVCRENHGRLQKLLALHGEPISPAGSVPLSRMLSPDPTAIRLTAAQNYNQVSPIIVEALHLDPDEVEDAWQLFEILRLATQLMEHSQFDLAVGNYAAADRRRDATTGIDPIAAPQAEATKNTTLEELARCCHPGGLHLRAVDTVWAPGGAFRWGSPVAERTADEISRHGSKHPMVSGLGVSADRIELALRAVSRAVGAAATNHRANWVRGAGAQEIWLDR